MIFLIEWSFLVCGFRFDHIMLVLDVSVLSVTVFRPSSLKSVRHNLIMLLIKKVVRDTVYL